MRKRIIFMSNYCYVFNLINLISSTKFLAILIKYDNEFCLKEKANKNYTINERNISNTEFIIHSKQV